jgi:hypothetical protein
MAESAADWVKRVIIDAPSSSGFQPAQWYVDGMTKMDNNPSLLLSDYYTTNTTNVGGTMPVWDVTFGRLVRIPVANPREGHYMYEDVTIKTAKKRAKAASKLAKQIRKACQ